jgi:SAM-dependent methyltransferase
VVIGEPGEVAVSLPDNGSESKETATQIPLEEIEGALAALSSAQDLDSEVVERACAQVERLARFYLMRAFQEMGVFTRPGESYSLPELKQHLQVIPQYDQLFTVLLEMLAREQLLHLDADRIAVVETGGAGAQELATLREETLATFPDRDIIVRLVEACVPEYPSILTGEKSHLEVMFPGGSSELVENVYRRDVLSDHFNQLVAEAVLRAVELRLAAAPAARVSILEIGAGTGGTSAGVLARLTPHGEQISFDYTDISSAFVQSARSTFASYPFASFQVLDIDQDVEPQGFLPGSYDIIFAANVLHATSSISNTLRRVNALLKPAGTLIINEIMRLFDFTILTFGLTPGWWLFEDPESRLPNAPLLSAPLWRQALADLGFGRVISSTPFGAVDDPPQCVMVAERTEQVQPDRTVAQGMADVTSMQRKLSKELEGPALDTTVRRVINQQLQVMERQLELMKQKADAADRDVKS